MITLPQKILDALPLIKGRIVAAKSTKLYAKVNHRDNFVLVIALDNTPDHSEFYKVSRKIAGEIYDELR